jgi:hypothetical protein
VNLEIAIENLREISSVLEKKGVKHWVTDGSLLGLVRENKLLDHDADTDIGLFGHNFDFRVLEMLETRGFTLEHTFGDPRSSLEIALKRDGVKTDLFFFYRVWKLNGKLPSLRFRHSAFHDFTSETYRRIDYFYKPFGVMKKTFRDGRFPIPRKPERFLVQKYGVDWQTPVIKWDYAFDPLNARETDFIYNTGEQDRKVLAFLKGQSSKT